MKTQLGYIDLTGAFVFLICIGVAFGAFAMWAMPAVWGWIKPLIHSLTA